MKEKNRCSGTWTESRFNSFIKSGIRSLTNKWKPKYDTLNDSYTLTKVNKSTGRLAKHYKCNICSNDFTSKNVVVDHINPIVPLKGFDNWDNVINRALCEKEGFQVLCKSCHKIKSDCERKERLLYKAS